MHLSSTFLNVTILALLDNFVGFVSYVSVTANFVTSDLYALHFTVFDLIAKMDNSGFINNIATKILKHFMNPFE